MTLESPKFVPHSVDTTVNFCFPQVEEYVMENLTFKCTSVQRYQGPASHYLTCQYSFELFYKTLIKKTGCKSIFGDGGWVLDDSMLRDIFSESSWVTRFRILPGTTPLVAMALIDIAVSIVCRGKGKILFMWKPKYRRHGNLCVLNQYLISIWYKILYIYI